ncbi:MAG: hypothetical protein HY725_12900 [Candidatus Rokubacteria bacterium]|nr:hypothetical protein [Candidatus Rokubacteria bacterium]
MRSKHALEKIVSWGLLGLALLIAVVAVLDEWRRVGQPSPGFGVMENLVVGIGGGERGGLEPFDYVRALNGRILTSGREIQAEVKRHPKGTPLRYLLIRRGQLVETEVLTVRVPPRQFKRYLLEGLLPGLLLLALGAIVTTLRPGVAESRLFLAFCLIWFVTHVTYNDSLATYRFSRLFLAAWAFSPAIFAHLAFTFPQRRTMARRHPRIVWLPYVLSSILGALIQMSLHSGRAAYTPAAVGASYWGIALVLLIVSLVRTSVAGGTPLTRQRARVLTAGFTVGYLLPVVGTAVEAVFRIAVPFLDQLWRLAILFPLAVAYAMVRYNLFDLRAVIRLGTIYSAVTGLVVLAYAGSLTLLNVALAQFELELSVSPLIPAGMASLAVILLLNPVYMRTQALVDRLFFRQRYDAQQAIERLAGAMTTVLDLNRIIQLITQTVNEVIHPARRG